MKKLLLILGLSASFLIADGATNYKACAGCHGVDGQKVALGKSKKIAEMTLEELNVSMNGYKDGTYGGPMKGLMKGQLAKYNEAEIEELSKYIDTL